MSNVIIDRDKIDILANAISAKSGEELPLTLAEMVEAVDGIESNPAPNLQAKTYTVDSAGTETITADSGYDGLSEVKVTVPSGSVTGPTSDYTSGRYSPFKSGNYFAISTPSVPTTPSVSAGYISSATTSNRQVIINTAIPYNPTATVSEDTVTIPSGYYSSQQTKSVSSGTEGTPTATKGTVSNHSISVTPSVTNTTGYITGSTKTGTAVTVSASELVSGSDTVTSNDTYDVTNLAELVVNVSGGGSVTVTDEANATGTTCVITTGSAPSGDIPLNTQLIDFTAVKNGYIVDGNTGDEVVSQWSSCSDFTLIDPTMTFSYIGYQWYDIVFYDTSKNYISSITMYQDTDVTITNDYAHGTLTPSKIPSTAKYVRIDSYPTNPSSTQLSLIRTA